MRNPFESYRKHIDLIEHEKNIKKSMDFVLDFLRKNDVNIEEKRIKTTFNDLINKEIQYRFNRINHKIAYLICRFIQTDILYSKKLITDKMFSLHFRWFIYLFERIKKHKDEISKDALIRFHQDFDTGDPEIYLTIAERALFNYSHGELLDIFNDKSLHPYRVILEFENYYRFDYAYFFVRCEYLGKELGKCEKKDYGKNLKDIFQLENDNERTPPKIVEKELLRLYYTRNAISHPETAGIRFYKETGKVKIMNYNVKEKKYSYNEELDLLELYEIYYNLTLLDRGFVSATLAADIIKK